jgi:PAS domain S-box-containing protein
MVLHVDDEASFLNAARQILEMQGAFQVDAASSVEEAIIKMKEKEYDAIICDYIMPRKDGLQFLKGLRDSGNHIPFIIFTGKGREDVAIEALNLGADRYLSKIGGPETVYGELSHSLRETVSRRRAEKALAESEEKWRTLAEQSPNMIFVNRQGKVVYANKKCEEIMGYKKEEFYSPDFDFLTLIHPEHIDMVKAIFAKHMNREEIEPYQYALVTKEGKRIETIITTKSIKYEGEDALLGIVTDITERERTERTLRESQQKFEGLFRDNPEAAVYVDSEFHILDANPSFERLFGYRQKEVKGKRLMDVIVPEAKLEETNMLDEQVRNGHIHLDTVRKRKDGSLVPVSISAGPITVEHNLTGYVAVYKDISDLKKAQQQLEESKRHFQTLFNLMVDPVAIVDKTGKILAVTDKAEKITGFKKEEMVGKNFLRLGFASAKSKAIMIKNLAKRMAGMHVEPYEVEILTKDGRKLPFEINAETIDYEGKPADMVVFRDMSQRKNLEAKLRVVGTLTRHDARNKLSVVTMNTYLAKQKLASSSEVLQHLNEIESAAEEAERIFDFAKTYEMLGMEQLVNIDVERTLEETVHLFSNLQSVKVVNDCKGLTVQADSLLRQVFYNLIHNSLKHGQKVSQIRVSHRENGKDRLELVYEDDGVGIAKSEKKRILEEKYKNRTGHGLYVISKICEVYGWSIKETGEYGKGAQFIITIPRTNKIRE